MHFLVLEDTNVTVPTKFISDTKCNVHWVPWSSLNTCQTVSIDVKDQIDKKLFVRTVRYSVR